MTSRQFTPEEMRDHADKIEPHPQTRAGFMLHPEKARRAALMLRQAADMMESHAALQRARDMVAGMKKG